MTPKKLVMLFSDQRLLKASGLVLLLSFVKPVGKIPRHKCDGKIYQTGLIALPSWNDQILLLPPTSDRPRCSLALAPFDRWSNPESLEDSCHRGPDKDKSSYIKKPPDEQPTNGCVPSVIWITQLSTPHSISYVCGLYGVHCRVLRACVMHLFFTVLFLSMGRVTQASGCHQAES